MPKFYLLDHSLKTTGGHHFDYATRMGEAAEEAGYRVTIATNRRFLNRSIQWPKFRVMRAFPKNWEIIRSFAHHMYSDYCAHNGWNLGPIGLDGEIIESRAPKHLVAGMRDTTMGDRASRLRRFEESCETIFERSPAEPNDVVFLPSMTEFDLLGLARYLRRSDWTKSVPFHVQVHFGMCEDRETEYDQHADVFANVRHQMRNAIKSLHDHQIFFYATTQRLADQFNSLEVCRFDSLAYPINPAFELREPPAPSPAPSSMSEQPLRVSSAGAVRKEKGQQFLSDLIRELWIDGFENRSLQLAVQCKPKRMSRKPRTLVSEPIKRTGSAIGRVKFRRPSEKSNDRVVYCRHPLAESDYIDFIKRSDIGLLMYDSQRYYARHAGVMGEYLASGIPVIVPAGCWLSDQLEGPIQTYRASQWDEAKSDSLNLGENESRALSSSNLLVRVECRGQNTAQPYLRLRTTWLGDQGCELETEDEIVALPGSRVAFFMSSRPNAARRFRLEITSAFNEQVLNVVGVSCLQLDVDSAAETEPTSDSSLPIGRVGLIAADVREVPRLVKEIVAHYQSYHASAGEFSTAWYDAHRPSETLRRLLKRAQPSSKRMHAA